MRGHGSERLNVIVTVLLSIAALATSWAGFQASVWNGNQSLHGVHGTALRASSTRASTRAGQQRIVDVLLFTNWLEAYMHGSTRLATFYEHRFRPEFRPAFRAWIASRPLQSADAAPSPFVLREYHLDDDEAADRLGRAADDASEQARRANAVSTGYVLDAVILATVMFFATAADGVGVARLRVFLLCLATAICGIGIYRLATSPRLWST